MRITLSPLALWFTMITFISAQLLLDLNGAGSTAIEPLQNQLALRFQPTVSTATRIAYNATGSGQGKTMLIQKQVDFAWSESPLTTEEQLIAPNLLMLPMYATGVAIVYNLPGLDASSPALNLTVQLLVAMYKGEVNRWDDSRILSLNPFLGAVSRVGQNASITRFVRAEPSGTTSILTCAFQVFDPTWPNRSVGLSPEWPGSLPFVRAQGSAGVAMSVIWNPFSIGYVSYETAILYGLTPVQFVSVENSSANGSAVIQQLSNQAIDNALSACVDVLTCVGLPRVVAASVASSDGAYPIVGFSFLLFPALSADCAKAYAMMKFVAYLLGEDARMTGWKFHFVAPSLATPLHRQLVQKIDQLQCYDNNGSSGMVLVSSLKARFELTSINQPSNTTPSVQSWIIMVVVSLVGVIVAVVLGIVIQRKVRIRQKLQKFPRGLVTFVFTDIQDSTRLWNEYPNSFGISLEMHNNLARELLAKYQGYEVKTHGDSFMVSFSSTAKAVYFAMELQRQLLCLEWPAELLSDELLGELRVTPREMVSPSARPILRATSDFDSSCPSPHPVSAMPEKSERQEASADHSCAVATRVLWRGLRVRIGMHCGENVRPRYNGGAIDYFGTVVNTAARVSALAQGGQTLMTRPTYEHFLRESISTHDPRCYEVRVLDLGMQPLKGLPSTEIVSVCPAELEGRAFAPCSSPSPSSSLIRPDTAPGQGSARFQSSSQSTSSNAISPVEHSAASTAPSFEKKPLVRPFMSWQDASSRYAQQSSP